MQTVPLTLEHAEANGFSAIDCVKYFNPTWEDYQCTAFLWEHTCFPFDGETTIKQLNEAFLNKEVKPLNMNRSIYDLELGESTTLGAFNVYRVPGGWIFEFTISPNQTVFVPIQHRI